MKSLTVKSSQITDIHYGPSRMVDDNVPEYLVGRIATLIESWGLRESQERAAKSLAKQEIYNVFSIDHGGQWLPNELTSVIRHLFADYRKQSEAAPVGTPFMNGPAPMGDYELTFVPKV